MTALDALAPTTAALHRHIAAAVPPVPSIPADDSPRMLKYIILEAPDGTESVLLFSRSLQHRDALPESLRPISAGFVILYDQKISVPKIGSDTLRLDPRPQDHQIISALLLGTPVPQTK